MKNTQTTITRSAAAVALLSALAGLPGCNFIAGGPTLTAEEAKRLWIEPMQKGTGFNRAAEVTNVVFENFNCADPTKEELRKLETYSALFMSTKVQIKQWQVCSWDGGASLKWQPLTRKGTPIERDLPRKRYDEQVYFLATVDGETRWVKAQ